MPLLQRSIVHATAPSQSKASDISTPEQNIPVEPTGNYEAMVGAVHGIFVGVARAAQDLTRAHMIYSRIHYTSTAEPSHFMETKMSASRAAACDSWNDECRDGGVKELAESRAFFEAKAFFHR